MADDLQTKWQFEKCVDCSISKQAREYDFDSLMHYTNDAFITLEAGLAGKKTIEAIDDPDRVFAHSSDKHTFSPLDLLGILDLYDCKGENSFRSGNTPCRK